MGAKIPPISGREMVKILSKLGIVPVRQTGSHVQLKGFYLGANRVTTVPIHGKDIPKGLTLEILKDCGISREEFLKLL